MSTTAEHLGTEEITIHSGDEELRFVRWEVHAALRSERDDWMIRSRDLDARVAELEAERDGLHRAHDAALDRAERFQALTEHLREQSRNMDAVVGAAREFFQRRTEDTAAVLRQALMDYDKEG